jgi:hypothetical protein
LERRKSKNYKKNKNKYTNLVALPPERYSEYLLVDHITKMEVIRRGMKFRQGEIGRVQFNRLFVCFPGVTTHRGCIFHSPVANLSLLVFEVP